MDLMNAIDVSAQGMAAQNLRMKVISENIANAGSVESAEGGPYRRRMVNFQAEVDRETGMMTVKPNRVERDYVTPLKTTYDPTNPYADANGVVQMPNVDTLVESIDMREATRVYEASMQAIESAKQMMARSLNMLR